MAEPRFGGDDDLPRTLRRAREEQERERRERASDVPLGVPQGQPIAVEPARHYDPAPPMGYAPSGAVTRFEVPFFHLVRFFLKAVFAAIPALLLLAALLWLGGKALQTFFPHLGRMQIHIQFVGGEGSNSPATTPATGPPAPPIPAPAPAAAPKR